jgi:cytochrome c oxidase assembly factor CtaG
MTRDLAAIRKLLLLGALLCAARPAAVLAHAGHQQDEATQQERVEGPHGWNDLWTTWGWEPGSIIALVITGWLYGRGVRRAWKSSGIDRGIRRWQVGCFAAGWLTLFVALVSPLHPWGQVLFSVHMIQHELLMLFAAPLLVLSSPLVAFLRAFPTQWAARLARLSNSLTWQRIWGTVSNPLVAWLIHGVVLWAWHAPALFQATLHNDWIHALQHVSFLGSALLFWWALIHCRSTAMSYGAAVLYLFTTAIHTGLLGALLTFAGRPWYPDYAATTHEWGLTPLEDQQLGGLIMWVPACTVYIVAGLALFAMWMRESERRVQQREARLAEAGPRLQTTEV